jgi:hypothetical protein
MGSETGRLAEINECRGHHDIYTTHETCTLPSTFPLQGSQGRAPPFDIMILASETEDQSGRTTCIVRRRPLFSEGPNTSCDRRIEISQCS